jgi:hypothetical protein
VANYPILLFCTCQVAAEDFKENCGYGLAASQWDSPAPPSKSHTRFLPGFRIDARLFYQVLQTKLKISACRIKTLPECGSESFHNQGFALSKIFVRMIQRDLGKSFQARVASVARARLSSIAVPRSRPTSFARTCGYYCFLPMLAEEF